MIYPARRDFHLHPVYTDYGFFTVENIADRRLLSVGGGCGSVVGVVLLAILTANIAPKQPVAANIATVW